LRANVDVVVVGAATVLADDPQLTVRRVCGSNPARAIIDPHRRVPAGLRWQAENGVRRILITSSEQPGCTESAIHLPCGEDGIAPREIVKKLFALGLKKILIEGGPATIRRFLLARCLDRLHVCVSPMIIGPGKHGIDVDPVHSLDQALRPATRTFLLDDGEVLFDCDMRA